MFLCICRIQAELLMAQLSEHSIIRAWFSESDFYRTPIFKCFHQVFQRIARAFFYSQTWKNSVFYSKPRKDFFKTIFISTPNLSSLNSILCLFSPDMCWVWTESFILHKPEFFRKVALTKIQIFRFLTSQRRTFF